MDELMKMLSQMSSQDVVGKIGNTAGLDANTAMNVVGKALPMLMGALGNNARDAQKAQALDEALAYHQNDNVNDIQGFLGNMDVNDAQKMLNHILSGKKDVLQQQVAQSANVSQNQVNDVMTRLAPLVMGMLGNQKKANNLGIGDIAQLLGAASGQGGQSGGLMDMATKMFDKDGDGSLMGEAMDFISKIMKK